MLIICHTMMCVCVDVQSVRSKHSNEDYHAYERGQVFLFLTLAQQNEIGTRFSLRLCIFIVQCGLLLSVGFRIRSVNYELRDKSTDHSPGICLMQMYPALRVI